MSVGLLTSELQTNGAMPISCQYYRLYQCMRHVPLFLRRLQAGSEHDLSTILDADDSELSAESHRLPGILISVFGPVFVFAPRHSHPSDPRPRPYAPRAQIHLHVRPHAAWHANP